jgi:hypothetical protein
MTADHPASSRKRSRGSRFRLLLVLSIALSLAGTAPGTRAGAAPNADESVVSYTLWIPGTGNDLCTGVTYTLPAEVREHVQAVRPGGILVGELRHRGTAALVEASVSDEQIAGIEPAAIQTGWDEDYGGRGRAEFSLHAKKAGQTSLYVKGTVNDRVVDQTNPITVVDCKYRVSLVAFTVTFGSGFSVWAVGKMDTQVGPDANSGMMNGAGTVKFNSGFKSSVCTVDYSFFQNPTTITGPPVKDDLLLLNFQFDPGTLISQVTCPVGGGTEAHTIDLTNLNLPPVSFPAEGGTRVFRPHYAGSDAGDTTVIITAELID